MDASETLQKALDTGKQLAAIADRTVDILGLPHALLPTGMTLQPLKETIALADQRAERDKPRLLKGCAVIGDEASFVEHVARFKDASSVIFASKQGVLAVYDYSRPAVDGKRDESARFGHHRASFAPEVSEEWKAWIGGAGKHLQQEAFADFLDEHLYDLVGPIAATENDPGRKVPSPADLATMAYSLKVTSEDVLDSTLNRTTGEYTITAKVAQTTTGSAQIPPEFDICIPIFTGGPKTRITCKLRLRKQDTKFLFGWVVPGAPALLRTAMDELAARIKEATALPVITGSPEA